MWFLGHLATYLASAMFGMYLNEFFARLLLGSHLGYAGEQKERKEKTTKTLLKHASSAFGVGGAYVAFMHQLPWYGLAITVILTNIAPVFLFLVFRTGRHYCIAAYNKWSANR